MSLLKAANYALDSIHRSTPSDDHKLSENTDSWRPWIISSAIGASVFGLIYSAAKFRCRPHDNIPPIAPNDFGIMAGHLSKLASLPHMHNWMYESMKAMGFPAVCSLSIPGQHYVIISDPKLIKFCLSTNFEYCIRAEKQCIEYEPLLGKGIFLSNGERWRFHRKGTKSFVSLRLQIESHQ